MWYVYILECTKKRLYTGITTDITRRLSEHRAGKGANFTRAFGAKKIVYSEQLPTRSAALKREAQIKAWPRIEKIKLYEKGN